MARLTPNVARELLLAKIGKMPAAYAALREASVAWDWSTYGPGHVLSLGLQAGMELATDKARAEDLLRQARARAEQERRWPHAAAAAIIDIGRGLSPWTNGRLSERHLRRVFREAVGVSPKEFTRLSRFHRALRVARENGHASWASIAAAAGYYDQAHLIAEFRAIAGAPPRAFLNELRAASSVG